MKKVILTCLVVFLYSCDLIFVENISEDNIIAIAPVSNSVLEDGTINFSWRELEDVDEYSFQIAVPNFELATSIVVDTIVLSTSINQELTEGDYEWRVKGSNEEFETPYTSNSFLITKDISDDEIVALLPLEDTELSEGIITFSWEALEGVDEYNLQISSPNFTGSNETIIDTLLTTTSFNQELLERDYEWRVKGNNKEFETEYTNNPFTVTEN